MKNIIAVIMIALAAMAFFGCSNASESENAADNTVTVALEENPSTGYTWSYTADKEGVLKEVNSEFIDENTDENIAGAPGKRIYTFEAENDGTVTLTFEYKQDWEGGAEGQTYVVTYKIENGKIEEYAAD